MTLLPVPAAVAAGTVLCALAAAPAAQAQSRGEALYATHCIACHTTQMHWRHRKLANDWNSLRFQVRRWQANALLGWGEDDILDVTRYLNQIAYRFEPTSDSLSFRHPPTSAPAPSGHGSG